MDLSKFIITGTLLELEVKDAQAGLLRFHVVVDQPIANGVFTTTSPMAKSKNYNLRDGATCKLIFSVPGDDTNQEAYGFKVKVMGKRTEKNFSTVRFEKISELEKVQRRGFFRFSIVKRIQLISDGTEIEMLTKNLSATGVRGVTDEHFHPGKRIKVVLPLDATTLTLESEIVDTARTVNRAQKFDVRVQFLNITESQKTLITNYIFSQQSKMIRKNMDEHGLNSSLVLKQVSEADLEEERINYLDYIAILSWLMLIIQIGLLLQARPDFITGLDVFFNNSKSSAWHLDILAACLIVGTGQLILNSLGLYANVLRYPEKHKKHNMTFQVNTVISGLYILFVIYIITLS